MEKARKTWLIFWVVCTGIFLIADIVLVMFIPEPRNIWLHLTGSAFTIVMFLTLILLTSAKWVGGTNDEHLYCEMWRNDYMCQPVNTLTNLAYVISGMVIMFFVSANACETAGPMAAPGEYIALYGLVTIFLGFGSIYYHASMKKWAGWVDNISMFMFMAFLPCYDIIRIFKWDLVWFLVMYIGIIIVGAVIAHWKVLDAGKIVFAVLIAVWFIIELVMVLADSFGKLSIARDYWMWYAMVVPTFVVAFLIWWFSRTDKVLCKPNSWFQGHAVWHLLTAADTVMIFVYLLSEVA